MAASEEQLESMDKDEMEKRLKKAYGILEDAGCHYVIDCIKSLPRVITDINRRLAAGERP